MTPLLNSLLAPLTIGDELMSGVKWIATSSELGLRVSFDDGGQLVHVEVFPKEPPRPHAAESARWLFAYRSTGEISTTRGQAICRAVATLAAANEHRVLGAIEPNRSDAARIREVRGGTILERANGYFTVSPYVGCLIGCRFCYAQERVGIVRALTGLPPAPWGSFVDARADAPELLRSELGLQPLLPIKFCPIVSDPYHAIEARLRLTRGCLEVLAANPRPVLLLTRAALIERDLDVLAMIPIAYAGFSLPTIDDAVRGHFEPRAASIEERLRILAGMKARGLRTFAVVQPILPGSIVELADALAGTASSVSIDVLRGELDAAPLFDAHPFAREASWQSERSEELANALAERGVVVWSGELPPELTLQNDQGGPN